ARAGLRMKSYLKIESVHHIVLTKLFLRAYLLPRDVFVMGMASHLAGAWVSSRACLLVVDRGLYDSAEHRIIKGRPVKGRYQRSHRRPRSQRRGFRQGQTAASRSTLLAERLRFLEQDTW